MNLIKAQVVADSKSPQGHRITTLQLTYPRIIHSEMMTHRALSKNTASSRAIPFERMVESVDKNPFVPIAWQEKHKGMQGTSYITDEDEIHDLEQEWFYSKDLAIQQATKFHKEGVTKQLCNRLLEPYQYITCLVTATDEGWENFFQLRCPEYSVTSEKSFRSKKDFCSYYDEQIDSRDSIGWFMSNSGQAEIHIMDLAEKIWDAMNESTPKELKAGEWHIPYANRIDQDVLMSSHKPESLIDGMVKVSTGMAARTSYTTVGDEKEITYETLIGIHDKMLAEDPFHASPFEHCAQAMSDKEYYSYVRGSIPSAEDEYGFLNHEYYPYVKKVDSMFTGGIGPNPRNGDRYGWCRNYRGFIQYRHIVEGAA